MEVNRVCTDEEYQKQYLEHSTCLQAMTAGPEWCSRHYTELLRVSHADTVRQSDLCCAHFKYRRCMLGKYSRCGREMIPQYKPAKEFVQRVMDNALSFFRDYCTGYCVDPVSDNCSGISELEAELMQEDDYSPATDICSKPIPSDSNSPSFTGLQSSRSPLDTNEIDSRRRSGRKEDNDVYPSSARLAPESREGFQGPSDGARLPPSDRRMDRGFGDLQPAPQPRGALDETQSYFGGKVNYAGFAGSYGPESREPSDVWSPAASNDINAQSLSGGNKGAPTSSPSNTLMHLAALICSLVFILH
ncbi:unnamed protein product [Cyprideis torosa]|uniref:Uncharacterized protein n=1 Tax=Cyprideis torosa TaxID=163714 RepID=A0A7R8WB93_9CRUS|nr:unnamed protein product [Cyprideis torosa]CAG0886667.1 unnamed protein product [Cyprideis torosa]